jgi:plasmid stability protein
MQIVNAAHLTVRNLPDEVAAALERERRRRGLSLNQTVIDLLRQGLGVPGTRTNGIGRLAGTWSDEEHREFLSAVSEFEAIDPDFWK